MGGGDKGKDPITQTSFIHETCLGGGAFPLTPIKTAHFLTVARPSKRVLWVAHNKKPKNLRRFLGFSEGGVDDPCFLPIKMQIEKPKIPWPPTAAKRSSPRLRSL